MTPPMIYIENEAAIFRGNSVNYPLLLWNRKLKEWEPYKGSVPKDEVWGTVVTKEEAEEYMK